MNDDDKQPKRMRGRPRKPQHNSPSPRRKLMGRPSIGDNAKKVNLTIRISPIEAVAWRVAAKAKGITLAEYILAPLRKEVE